MGKHLALPVLAMAMLACGRSPTRAGAGSAGGDNQAILTKLQPYITCLDRTERIFHIADVYTGRFSAAPPTADTEMPIQPVDDPKSCVEGLDEAKKLHPALPELEAAGDAYAKAISGVFALTTAGHEAFDRASAHYAPASGIALHPRLLAAFHQFDDAQAALFDQIYRINHNIHLTELAAREQKDGRTLAIVADAMMLRAEDLVRFAATPWDRLDRLDLVAITQHLDQFEIALEALSSFALSNDFLALMKSGKEYLIAAKQLVARARGNIAFTDSEKIMVAANNERLVVGSPAAMVDAYNRLVDAYYPLEPR